MRVFPWSRVLLALALHSSEQYRTLCVALNGPWHAAHSRTVAWTGPRCCRFLHRSPQYFARRGDSGVAVRECEQAHQIQRAFWVDWGADDTVGPRRFRNPWDLSGVEQWDN